jgi:hypothetical protein
MKQTLIWLHLHGKEKYVVYLLLKKNMFCIKKTNTTQYEKESSLPTAVFNRTNSAYSMRRAS